MMQDEFDIFSCGHFMFFILEQENGDSTGKEICQDHSSLVMGVFLGANSESLEMTRIMTPLFLGWKTALFVFVEV